jgi:hypothetical protein
MVKSGSYYVEKAAIYCVVSAGINMGAGVLADGGNIWIPTWGGLGKDDKYQIIVPKLVNPIILCGLLRLPPAAGISAGLLSNHISANWLGR